MSRRPRSVRGGRGRGGSGRAPRSIYGISGWDASTALTTASGAGVDMSTAGGSLVMAFYLSSVPSAAQIACRRISGTAGYDISATSAAVLRGQFGNGSGLVATPTRTLVTGDVGKIHVVCATADIANTAARLYFDRAQVSTQTTLSALAVAALPMCLGSASNGSSPSTSFTILGIVGGDSPLTLADYQTICDATKAAGRLSLGGVTGMTHMYSAPQAAGSMPATLADSIGSEDMTFTIGSAANVDVVTLPDVWGF